MSSSDLHYAKRISSPDETPDEVANDIISILKGTKTGEILVTLAVAESLTGGGVMAALTSVEGASNFFRGGIVTYATPLKHTLLNVDAELIIDNGVIDGEVARQMAVGVRKRTTVHGIPTTWGVSTTGVAGPDFQDDKPVGTVYIGISSEEHSEAFGPYHFTGNCDKIREAAAVEALVLLRQKLIAGFHLVLVTKEQTSVDFEVAPGILNAAGGAKSPFKVVNGFNLGLG
jgi:nicotinamide-nucleotide amidase